MLVWGSKWLSRGKELRGPLAGDGAVVVLNFAEPAPAHWRILRRLMDSGRALHVAMTYDPAADLAEVYHARAPLRGRLLDMGFVETAVPRPPGRPPGLAQVERVLFGTGPAEGRVVPSPDGLIVRGGPRGDGAARVVAREVRSLLDRGVDPDDLLILFPTWTEEAALTLETLRAWDIPARTDARLPLRNDPGVSALRLAASIPLEEWETDRIVRLLRHGQVRPDWPGEDRLSLASAASTIKSARVFRGREQALRGLERLRLGFKANDEEYRRIDRARAVIERLFDVLGPLDDPRRWKEHVVELRRAVADLGVEMNGGTPIETWLEGLDDHSDSLDRLGRANERWTWAAFVAEAESILGELDAPSPEAVPGSVRLATVDEADGAGADWVILADLSEGTFPGRAAVQGLLSLRPGEKPGEAARAAYAGEMLRFLEVLGSARKGVILAYPTTDPKGQELLRAGFLDDLLLLLDDRVERSCHTALPRLHAALVDAPELAGSAADVRVRAAALAAERGESELLSRLASDPVHRRILDGTAGALHAAGRRQRGTDFGEYDGLIRDGAALLELDRFFGPSHAFSASQLETYLSCPFQFYARHVLKLRPVEEHDELAEDLTQRGSDLHDILEKMEARYLNSREEPDWLAAGASEIERISNIEPANATDLDLGLWEIQKTRLIDSIRLYIHQRQKYGDEDGRQFAPRMLELDFGSEGAEYPMLEIRDGAKSVRLLGRIDRIDVSETDAGLRFRVIDYKSGHTPSTGEVRSGAMLQLPLYAMAVERIVFQDRETILADLGYWGLKDDGYTPISFGDWEEDKSALIAHVLSLVDQLRRGVFVVHSRRDGCESFCDYRGVCRIGQVRRAGKRFSWILPTLSVPPRRRTNAAGASAAAAERGGA
ncbi:PD-(D/E)XK nuclease family protein [Aquisphaera insulae]|uniref:PD-(D/E)XK nuclease family protein n=1 Tax=Aquisphaera insulae TaxID=2712864 RepID=UPI0034E296AE